MKLSCSKSTACQESSGQAQENNSHAYMKANKGCLLFRGTQTQKMPHIKFTYWSIHFISIITSYTPWNENGDNCNLRRQQWTEFVTLK